MEPEQINTQPQVEQPTQSPVPQTQPITSSQFNTPNTYKIKLVKCTGLILFPLIQSRWVTGTYQECLDAYKDTQTYNILFGWWSWISIITNWIPIFRNRQNLYELKIIAKGDILAAQAPIKGKVKHLKKYLLIFGIIAVIGVVFAISSFRQQVETNQQDKALANNLDISLQVASNYYFDNSNSFDNTSAVIGNLSTAGNSLKPTSGPARNSESMAVAVAGNGKQLSLVTTDGSGCLGLLYNAMPSPPNSQIPNSPTTAGTSYAEWVIPDGGCVATPLPTTCNGTGCIGSPTWSSSWPSQF